MQTVTVKLTPEVIDVLERSQITNSTMYLPAQLDRQLYQQVNEAITLIGGKWSRKFKGHVFQVEGDEIKRLWNQAIKAGEVVDKKKSFQFYQTPRSVTEQMLSFAIPMAGATILEPSCGHGAILDVIAELFPDASLVGVEIDAEKMEVLKAKGYIDVILADYLEVSIAPVDCIIANPPFTRKQDVKHITKMWSDLKAGGRMVSVASAGVKHNCDKLTKALRELVAEHGEIIDLPEGTFGEEGTKVNTCLVYLEKPLAS